MSISDPRTKRVANTATTDYIMPKIIPSVIEIPRNGNCPAISLNKKDGNIFINGRCLPADPVKFFEPLIDWANKYAEDPHSFTNVMINADYINTGSIKSLCIFFDMLLKVELKGCTLIIKWYCEPDDTDIDETIVMVEAVSKVKIEKEIKTA